MPRALTVELSDAVARFIDHQIEAGHDPRDLVVTALVDLARRSNLSHVMYPQARKAAAEADATATPKRAPGRPKGTLAYVADARFYPATNAVVLTVDVEGIGARNVHVKMGPATDARPLLARFMDVTDVEDYSDLKTRELRVTNIDETNAEPVDLPYPQIEAALAELKARGIE